MAHLHLCTALVLFLATIAAVQCDVHCDHTITGSVNARLIVDGTNCVLTGPSASANGAVRVLNGGNLTISGGASVNADVVLDKAGFLRVHHDFGGPSGRISTVTDMNGGVGELTICGATLSGPLKSTGRLGSVTFGAPGPGACADTVTYGPITVTGGQGPTKVQHVKNNMPSISVTDRAGRVDVADISATTAVTITGCTGAKIKNTLVYDSVTIKDIGEDGKPDSGFANLAYVTVYGTVKVQNVNGFVCIPSLKSSSTTQLLDNTGGIGLYNSMFNTLVCNGNDYGIRDDIVVENTTINSGQGQCERVGN